MIRMLTQPVNDARSAKCVYVAPTKVRLYLDFKHKLTEYFRHYAPRSIMNGLRNLEDLVLNVGALQWPKLYG